MTSDLVTIHINGLERQISKASPFLGFKSINQDQGTAKDVPSSRLNQNQLQLEITGGYAFKMQIAAWYNAVSLDSWHPDVKKMLKSVVVSIGTGPWGSGVWWGN